MRFIFRLGIIPVLLVASLPALAVDPEPGALFAKVVDVGAGECCVIKIPGGHNIVYDAGNYEDGGATAIAAIRKLIPTTEPIDLMILSHSDSDHLAATPAIFEHYTVKRIIYSGVTRTGSTWKRADAAIRKAGSAGKCDVWSLKAKPLPPGTSFKLGEAVATLVCGFYLPPSNWDIQDDSERMNGGSIILRVSFRNRSILFCGDSVGRHIGAPASACIAAEDFMVKNRQSVPIRADALVAPHHGADNGSSTAFINAVHPSTVIFSAGHKFQHPRKTTVERYLAAGIDPRYIFRTDRSDDEGVKEWSGQRLPGNVDPRGDDDVDLLIRDDGKMTVGYSVKGRRGARQ